MAYTGVRAPQSEPVIQVQVADRRPYQYDINTHNVTRTSATGIPSSSPRHISHTGPMFDIGIFRDTLAPSLALHSSLAVAAWATGRYTGRVEAKDYLWPSAQLINAWWAAVGRRVILDGVPLTTALAGLSWPERLILAGVSAWGVRLTSQVVGRSVKRGKDNPRYEGLGKDESWWNNALVKVFLAEAVVQSVVSLPFTAPFRHQGAVMTGYHPVVQMVAVGVFGAGFALEALADWQSDSSKGTELQTEGVWSIVRHPNYLGDTLVHAAFPILLFGSDMLAPIELLGPIANYLYLRYVGGDMQTEHSHPEKKVQFEESRSKTHAFWPGSQAIGNPWTWIVIGCGVGLVGVEQTLRTYH